MRLPRLILIAVLYFASLASCVTAQGLANSVSEFTGNSAEFKKAIESGVVNLVAGSTYRIKTAFTAKRDKIVINGNGATIVNESGGTVLLNGNVTLRDVNFRGVSGDPNTPRLLQIGGGNDSNHVITGCSFTNLHSDTYAVGLAFADQEMGRIQVEDCKFEGITALANGTAGDANGSATGMYIASGYKSLVVNDCLFKNIDSVDQSGNRVGEDSNGIQRLSSNSFTANYTSIKSTTFEGIGKRCIKLHAPAVMTVVDRCICNNTWDQSDTKSMQSFGWVRDGTVFISNSKMIGQPAQYFLYFTSTNVDELYVTDCVYAPNIYKARVSAEDGLFVRTHSLYCNAKQNRIRGFKSKNTNVGIGCGSSLKTFRVSDSHITSNGDACKLRATEKNVVDSCSFVGVGTAAGQQGIVIFNGVDDVLVRETSISGFRDGIFAVKRSDNSAGSFSWRFKANKFSNIKNQYRDQSAWLPANPKNISRELVR